MKAIPFVACCAFALARSVSGQDFGESIQLSQPAVRGTGNAIAVPVAPLSSSPSSVPRQGGVRQGGVQVVNDAYRGLPDCHCAHPPTFLPSPREIAAGTPVILSSSNPNAVIYYTIDGWTPTESSSQYHAPIVISADTHIQAFAEEPGKQPSPVVSATYTINGAAAPLAINADITGATLPKGTTLRMQTGNRVSSETASVGDRFYLLLDQNLVANGKVIAARGMSVEAKVTSVQRAGQNGRSGVIVFQLAALSAHGVTIPLSGTYTLVAHDIGAELNHISDTSFVHVSGPLPPGNDAKIEPGMSLTAAVAADVALPQ